MKSLLGTLHKQSLCLLIAVAAPLFAQMNDPQSPPEDSITASLCNNDEQIVSRRNGDYRIEYYMGETQLNMKTMNGFLSLNSASKPFHTKFRTQRLSGTALIIAGIGLVIADGFISEPSFPVFTLGGVTAAVSGLAIYIKSNDKFRLAIHAYNKDICKIK